METRLILVQFSFSNKNVVPSSLPWAEEEKSHQSRERARRNTTSGNSPLVGPLESCSLEKLVDELTSDPALAIVDAFAQSRIKLENRRRYSMARFTFCESTQAREVSEEFSELAISSLRQLAEQAIWRVRAYESITKMEMRLKVRRS